MSPWAQAGIIGTAAAACYALGHVWAVFAIPAGQLALLLLWGLAPWWVIVPVIGIFWMLLFETFGPGHWPYGVTLVVWTIAMLWLGPWWRSGRGWFRPAVLAPLLLLMPWLLMRLLVSYSPFEASHLGWIPPGLLSMALVWTAVLAARYYQPRRRTYRLGVHY
ncbi:MAG TPA: hypothetical protein VEI97_18640 [bacterium]|nr:hypothetical protein [bacterium]